MAAALGNSYDAVLKAMLHDPMNAWIEDPDKIEYLTKIMLYYTQEWLPEPWKEWIPKQTELQNSKYWVSPKELAKDRNRYLEIRFPPAPELRKKAFFWQ